MSRYHVSRYGYDYSLTPARPTGWRGTLANITIFATVMAVSAIGGVVVTLELFGSPAAPPVVATPATASLPPASQAAAQPAARPMTKVLALVTTPKSAPATASAAAIVDVHAAPPVTVAAAPAVEPSLPPPPAAAQAPQPQPTPVADSDLTFAKGYAQRQAIARGAPVRHGKVVVEAKTNLGRTALKSKPKTYVRNTNTPDDQRRVAAAQRPDAFGMFQRFERPDQFDFNHHQALAFGEQRTSRRNNNDAPRPAAPAYGNSPNGLFGGLF
jgi:hypothetical protein